MDQYSDHLFLQTKLLKFEVLSLMGEEIFNLFIE